jgi:hypothetical protein
MVKGGKLHGWSAERVPAPELLGKRVTVMASRAEKIPAFPGNLITFILKVLLL